MYSSRSKAEKLETQKKAHTHKTTESRDNLQSHNKKTHYSNFTSTFNKARFQASKNQRRNEKNSPLQLSIISNNNNKLTRDLDYLLQHNNATISSSSFKYFCFFFFFRG
jgi:hypothetical protein